MRRALGLFLIVAPGLSMLTVVSVLTGSWVPALITLAILAAVFSMAFGFMLMEDDK